MLKKITLDVPHGIGCTGIKDEFKNLEVIYSSLGWR